MSRFKKLAAVIVVFQILMILLYGTMVRYDDSDVFVKGPQFKDAKEEDQLGITYTMFQVRNWGKINVTQERGHVMGASISTVFRV